MNQTGLLPSCWGPAFWHVLHSIAYTYNPEVDRESYYQFFTNLVNILPCQECRLHYAEKLNLEELEQALETNETLFRYVYDLHNQVNVDTGKTLQDSPSYESVKERYGSFKASCSEMQGVCGSPKGNPKMSVVLVDRIDQDKMWYHTPTQNNYGRACIVVIFVLLFFLVCILPCILTISNCK